jgi:homoserine dehydrogenase
LEDLLEGLERLARSDRILRIEASFPADGDPDGSGSARRLAALARAVWRTGVTEDDVAVVAPSRVNADDVERAARAGRSWRLIAAASAAGCLVVEPRQLRAGHPLAGVGTDEACVVVTTADTGRFTLRWPPGSSADPGYRRTR